MSLYELMDRHLREELVDAVMKVLCKDGCRDDV